MAWLSARVVRCWLSPATSATLLLVAIIKLGTLARLPLTKRRLGGGRRQIIMPLCSGYTYYNGNSEPRSRETEPISKCYLSSDCRLQLACMKQELLVMAGQHTAVNTFPPCTHRPSHHESVTPGHSLTVYGRCRRWDR